MDEIDNFADVARAFQTWATAADDEGRCAALKALRILTRLLAAGADLRALPDGADGSLSTDQIPDAEWRQVLDRASRLPFRYYSELLDPMPVPARDDPVVGDVTDDIADIYRDIVGGLRLYDAGKRAEAAWNWVFDFENHWGEHATSAVRAIYCYLREGNEFTALDT